MNLGEWLLKTLLPMLKSIIQQVTPDLLKELKRALQPWIEKAYETPNPFDDLLAFALETVLSFIILPAAAAAIDANAKERHDEDASAAMPPGPALAGGAGGGT